MTVTLSCWVPGCTGTEEAALLALGTAATSTCTGGSSCGVTNCHWIEQFFPKGTRFWDLNGNLDPSCLGLYWSWYYFLPAGGDESCAQVTSNWVTASWNNLGKDPVDGNIFAPGDTDC